MSGPSIVFYNPHTDDLLAEPPHFRLLGRRPLAKYGYLLQGALQSDGFLALYVDATCSAFIPEGLFAALPGFARRFVVRLEMARWVRINRLTSKVRIYTQVAEIADRPVFCFSYKAVTGPLFARRRRDLSRLKCLIVHLSHYFVSTGEKASNLRQLPNAFLAGDSDIRKNSYFLRFFDWYNRPLLQISFSVDSRFTKRTEWEARNSKAIATGTFHDLTQERPARKYSDFCNFFGSDTYHPVRKLIADHQAALASHVAIHVTPYRERTKRSLFGRLLDRFSIAQKNYFKADIVALYNAYRYAVVGEEAVGFPALGAFEAMACGTVLIGQPDYYEGIGVQQGREFIAYDGSLAGLRTVIDQLNAQPEWAASLSAAGAAFVEENMRPAASFRQFLGQIRRAQDLAQ